MAWQDVPAFFKELQKRDAISARALQFAILTGARTGEILKAEWSQIDGENWHRPMEMMKGKKAHSVPLSHEAQEILASVKGISTSIIFEGQKRNAPMSNMAMANLLERMGYKKGEATVHGFRTSFRVWCAEAAGAPRELAEMCLAHEIGNKVEQAYNRTDLLEKRRLLMQRWANFITQNETKIVRIG